MKKRTKEYSIKSTKTITLSEYLDTSYSYEVYCSHLDNLYKVEAVEWKALIPKPMLEFYEELKVVFADIAKQATLNVTELIKALKNKDLFALFKAIRFNLKVLLKALQECLAILHHGLTKVFEELHKTEVFKALANGARKIDDVLDQYPLLRKLSGPVLAGLLLYMWMSMAFLGDPGWDFDMSDIVDALRGHFSIYELFASPEGLTSVTAFLLGTITGISFPWVSSNVASVLIALLYTSLKKLKNPASQHLRKLIPIKRL